jgi:CheY-like chemotaxis protein
MAHALGAQLEVSDNQPNGSRFVLKGRFESIDHSQVLDVDAVLNTLAGKRILVVDDLKYNQQAVVDFLENLGCICASADDGEAALHMLCSTHYDIALLDWDLPGLSGPEVARRYRTRFPDHPVLLIAVTAYTDADKKAESIRAGMNGYISKPLSASRLAHTLGGVHAPRMPKLAPRDLVVESELQNEIHAHVAECLAHGSRSEMEALRVCAHKLTSLALIADDRPLQSLCREIQIAASENNLEQTAEKLLLLRKWKGN